MEHSFNWFKYETNLLCSPSPLVTLIGSTFSQSGAVLFVQSSISFSACSFQLGVFKFSLNTCPHSCKEIQITDQVQDQYVPICCCKKGEGKPVHMLF